MPKNIFNTFFSFCDRYHVLLVVGIFLLVLWGVCAPLFQDGNPPWDSDTMGHLYKSLFLYQEVVERGVFPSWLPFWYMGDAFLQYYPPVGTVVLFLLTFVFSDVVFAYKVLLFVVMLGTLVVTYFVLLRSFPKMAAFFSSLFFVFAPYTLHTMFSHGNLPRSLFLVGIPLYVYLIDTFIHKQRKCRVLVLLGLLMGVLLLTHVMQAAMLVCIVAFFLLFNYVQLKSTFKARHILLWVGTLGAGFLYSAFWIIPAQLSLEAENVPYLALEKIPIYSGSLDMFLLKPPADVEKVYVGLSLLGLACWGWYHYRKQYPKVSGYFAAGLIALFCSMGSNIPGWLALPLVSNFLPERFLNLAVYFLAVPGGLGGYWFVRQSLAVRARWWYGVAFAVLAVVAGVFTYKDYSFYFRYLHTRAYEEHRERAELLAEKTGKKPQGRLLCSYCDRYSASSYFFPLLADQPIVHGYSIEGTPLHDDLANVRYVLREREFFPYMQKKYALWNVESVFLEEDELEVVGSFLQEMGFEAVEFSAKESPVVLSLYQADTPFSYVQEQRTEVLVVGANAATFAMLFPGVTEGFSSSLQAYGEEYFDPYGTIVVSGVPYAEIDESHGLIRKLVAAGKRVIVDITDTSQSFMLPSALGVEFLPFDIKGEVETTTVSGGRASEEDFVYEDVAWRGSVLEGVDEPLAHLRQGEEYYSIAGVEHLEEGDVYFTSMNLPYHAFLHRDEVTMQFLLEEIIQVPDVAKFVPLDRVAAEGVELLSDRIVFSYEAQESVRAVISSAYSPRWRAYLAGSGAVLPLHNYEHLLGVDLPAGKHQVVLRYESSAVQFWAVQVSLVSFLVTLAGVVACCFLRKRRWGCALMR